MSDRDHRILQNLFSAWDFIQNALGRKESREEFDNDSKSKTNDLGVHKYLEAVYTTKPRPTAHGPRLKIKKNGKSNY
jgi:hypothetical protein